MVISSFLFRPHAIFLVPASLFTLIRVRTSNTIICPLNSVVYCDMFFIHLTCLFIIRLVVHREADFDSHLPVIHFSLGYVPARFDHLKPA